MNWLGIGLWQAAERGWRGLGGRVAGIPPRSGSCLGGVAVDCSEISGWGPDPWMDASGETAEDSGSGGLSRSYGAEWEITIPGRNQRWMDELGR